VGVRLDMLDFILVSFLLRKPAQANGSSLKAMCTKLNGRISEAEGERELASVDIDQGHINPHLQAPNFLFFEGFFFSEF